MLSAANTHNLPLQVGEIHGWRSWNIRQVGSLIRLASLQSGSPATIWTPGKMLEAICPKGCGHTPGESCTCGFYAASTKEHLASMHYPSYGQNDKSERVRVFGRVALAGKVIPGTQGWRAQYCWPAELFVPYEFTRLVEPLARTYKVPVSLDNIVYKLDKSGRS